MITDMITPRQTLCASALAFFAPWIARVVWWGVGASQGAHPHPTPLFGGPGHPFEGPPLGAPEIPLALPWRAKRCLPKGRKILVFLESRIPGALPHHRRWLSRRRSRCDPFSLRTCSGAEGPFVPLDGKRSLRGMPGGSAEGAGGGPVRPGGAGGGEAPKRRRVCLLPARMCLGCRAWLFPLRLKND